MPLPQLRSPLARAVVPVAAGIGFFVLLGLATYGIAVLISDNPDSAEGRLFQTTFRVGDAERVSDEIAENGPLIFPDLLRTAGQRTIVLDHEGGDPLRGWRVYFAHPADRTVECKVELDEGRGTFMDCEGRQLAVDDLQPAAGVVPVVEDRERLVIDLREAVAAGG